ncbi:MAG: imidazolonepropionase, partial [Flavobacteriaceae bacterium]
VNAGPRELEFTLRLKGKTYEEIAQQGGGILNSAKRLQGTSFDKLYAQSLRRLQELIQLGTGAIEIKSGYGLTLEAEIKMLKVIQKLKEENDLPICTTFLAAHAVPDSYKQNKKAYIDLICNEWIPTVADENLATHIDVFCEKNYFSVEESRRILTEGQKAGLIPKLHVNQFNALGGVAMATDIGAHSVDHLEQLTQEDIIALRKSKTLPVALPNCSFFLGLPYAPARQLLEADLPLVLASDYNPGSAPSGNMNTVVALACTQMKMTVEEAINAATINAAFALGLDTEIGSIGVGKRANLIVTKPLSSYAMLPYAFGSNLINAVYINGQLKTP